MPFTAIVDGRPIRPEADVIALDRPLAAGALVDLRFDAGPPGPGDSVRLDLGEVRGSAEVMIDQVPAATLTWSPYQADITAYLRPGANDVEVIAQGTLAGYLGSASPTPAVTQGKAVMACFASRHIYAALAPLTPKLRM